MTEQTPAYLIGIDLGTTHTVVAYADLKKTLSADNCQIFEIEQLVAPGEVAKRPLLPSFRYHPAIGEINSADLLLPWSGFDIDLAGEIDQVVIGEWARELGSKVDGRQVVSAKSWLSHPQVNRSANILPWAGAEGVGKVSPVLASASYLHHVRQAWNYEHPQALLEHQEIVITIPASFDEVARAFTVEAAKLAGLGKVLLLEEPQAVCYDWYARQGKNAQNALQSIKLLIVCDVGGGTTDLSLIKIAEDKNNKLSLTRIGVGDHLMLGGDNVDLALAHIAEQRLFGTAADGTTPAKKLSAASLSQLIQQTRKAKEKLLSKNAPVSTKITVLGSGAKLIGGTKSCDLSQQEVKDIALNGFFPESRFEERPSKRRSAVVAFGLPYAPDPAVSKHLAEFIGEHQSVCREALGIATGTAVPDAVLFNGGVFNSSVLSQRTLSVLSQWRGEPVTQLDNATPELAVAQGAVAYAKARRGALLKIGGGSARTFFLKLEDEAGSKQAVCLLPKGTEENQELTLSDRKFLLRLGQPVQFHLLSTSTEHPYKSGELINIDESELNRQHFISLPPLIVVFDTNNANQGRDVQENNGEEIEVQLATLLTEVGTLQVDCVADNNQRWHVEFEIRQTGGKQEQTSVSVTLPPKFNEAMLKIDAVFSKENKRVDPKAVKALRSDLEKILGKREDWEVPALRTLFDRLLTEHNQAQRSAVHERAWLNLAGFCLRPGYGYPADDWRIDQIWRSYQQGLGFNQETQSWIDWWNFWRRAAGGLSHEQQLYLYQDVARFIDPTALTSRKLQTEAKQKSYEDMVKLVASLEHLPVAEKTQLARWLLTRLEKSAETITSWWALGRIASRIPFHGSAHNVVDKDEIHHWLPQLLNVDWKKNPQATFAAVLMTRMSGDRNRDIDDDWRRKVIEKLSLAKASISWIDMVTSVKELDEAETKRVFGEGLPTGLTLIR